MRAKPGACSSCRAISSGRVSQALHLSVRSALRKVVEHLEVHPELRRGSKCSGEEPSGLWRDSTTAPDDLVDALEWHADVLCERLLCDAERLEEVLEQNLPGVGGNSVFGDHDCSVVVGEGYLGWARVGPPEGDSPLVVHADRVQVVEVTPQAFKTVAGRTPEVEQIVGGVELIQLAEGDADDIGRDLARPGRAAAVEEVLRGRVAEGLDHRRILGDTGMPGKAVVLRGSATQSRQRPPPAVATTADPRFLTPRRGVGRRRRMARSLLGARAHCVVGSCFRASHRALPQVRLKPPPTVEPTAAVRRRSEPRGAKRSRARHGALAEQAPSSWRLPLDGFALLAKLETMTRLASLPTTCPFPCCSSNTGPLIAKVHQHATHHTKAGPRARRRCLVCKRTFSATTGTPYARNRRPMAHFDRVVQMHSEGMTKAAISRVMRVSPSTVARWIAKAAAHARLFHDRHTRIDDPVEVQLDELSCRGSGRAKGSWVFSGIEVQSRVWVGLRVGTRTERNTRIHVREVSNTLTSMGEWTLFSTDGFRYYARVLQRVLADRPAVHIEVDNKYSRGRVVRSTWRRRMGSSEAHADAIVRNQDLHKPNTAFVERLNLTKRTCCSLLRRRNPSPARSPERIQEALKLVRMIYNYVRPHGSLRTLRGATTPAMAAGITKRPLRIREIFRWVVTGGEAAQLARRAQFAYSG